MANSEEKKIKLLEMIEKIIERMGQNSFQLKGWAVTLVSLLGAILSRDSNKCLFLLAFIPIVAFWFLDAFYLGKERKYRDLYKQVASKPEEKIDFSMDTGDLSVKDFMKAFISCTESIFYGAISAASGSFVLFVL